MASFLPPEILQHILSYALCDCDVCELWTTTRRVSRDWRAAIAQIYADDVLRDPRRCMLRFETHLHCDIEMTFRRYAEADRKRYVFALREEPNGESDVFRGAPTTPASRAPHESAYSKKAFRILDLDIKRYVGDDNQTRRFDLTPHLLCIDDKCMDSEISDLSFDPDTREVSFTWEPALANFFSEITQVSRALMREAREIGARARRDWDGLFSEYEDAINIGIMNAVEGARWSVLRDVRRRRIENHSSGQQDSESEDIRSDTLQAERQVHRIRRYHDAHAFQSRPW